MKIKRTIHGEEVEIELTSEELRSARWVAEEEYDKQYVLDLADMFCDEEMKELLKTNERIRTRVAHLFRKYMDEQIDGEAEFNCFNWAVEYCMEE